MKFTQVLLKQHLERMARRHWYIQGKKVVSQTNAINRVKEQGYEVVDGIQTYVNPPYEKTKLDPKLLLELRLPKDHTHPDYNTQPCYIFGDNNVLLAGTKQAQVLCNTVIASEPLPASHREAEDQCKVPPEAHEQLQRNILLSCVFDSDQKKLPKRKDPLRPAWNFPRDYGITDRRKNELLCQNLAALCELHLSTSDLSRVNNARFLYSTKAHQKLLQFDLTAEVLFTSRQPLTTHSSEKVNANLPVIHPLDCTVSIAKHNFYETGNLYPTSRSGSWPHAHTALLHFNSTEVKNLYDTEVTTDQIAGRLLIKAFTIAASQAISLQEGELKDAITVQVVQTDGQHFQFGVLQLNTLNLEGAQGERNLFWLTPSVPLYRQCSYVDGRPVLEGYNPDVLQRLLTFAANR